MPTKEQLRVDTLAKRGMVRVKDETTGRFTLRDSSVDKTPLMLYTEGVTGQPIEEILLKQLSTRRLADWITLAIGRTITQATIVNWRQRYKIYRIRK
jgi:hypothetical protein